MNLQGCALLAWNAIKPIEIEKKAVARTPLNLPDPTPIKPAVPRWIIITPENQARVFEELRAANADQVLFALTDDGYEELAIFCCDTQFPITAARDAEKVSRIL